MPALTMYDEAEFRNISPAIRFLKEVDSRTSYCTRQMLVAQNALSAAELELAARSARRKEDIEDMLLDEFQVKLPAMGQSLALFYGVPYGCACKICSMKTSNFSWPDQYHGGRNARRRNYRHRHRSLADRTSGAVDPAHQQRPGKRGALARYGHGPFNFADALLGILAQRLARRLCKGCKQPYTPAPEEIEALLDEYCLEPQHTPAWQVDPNAAWEAVRAEWIKYFADAKGNFTLQKSTGCDTCNNTGYRGRVGLHELLAGTDVVKKHIQERSHLAEIATTVLAEGMRTLKQDGIEKVLQGVTDIHQVRSVYIK